MRNFILLFILVPIMAFAQVTETWRADNYNLTGQGVITKPELYRLQGVTSNIQTQLNDKNTRLTTLEGYDKVLEYTNFAGFPGTGATATLYLDKALNKLYRWDGAAYMLVGDGTGTGDVVGPSSSLDNGIVRFDGATGKLIQDSATSIADDGTVTAYQFSATNPASTSSFSGLQINNSQILATGTSNVDLNTASSTAAINFKKKVRFDGRKNHTAYNDVTTGSNATLENHTTAYVRLTAAGNLVSVDGIPAGDGGDTRTILNITGANVTFNNETGATAANRIVTGTGTNLKVKNGGSIQVQYDTTQQRWYVVGGVGGSSGLGDTDTLYVQDFEGAVTGDFTISGGWALNISSPLHGDVDMKVTHAAATTTYSVKQSLIVAPKFRGKNLTIKFTTKSNASTGNVVLDAGCTTDTDLANGEALQFSSDAGGKEDTVSFDVPGTCTAMTWTVRALPDAATPVTEIEDVSIEITKVEVMSALVQEADSELSASGNAGQSITANVTDIPFIANKISGSAFSWNGSQLLILSDSVLTITGQVRYSTAISTPTMDMYIGGVNTYRLAIFQGGTTSFVPFSYTGKFTAGQVVSFRNSTSGTLINSATDHFIKIVSAGALKQANVNSNQKITIPTSEIRFEGTSSRGSTNTAIVKFDTIAKLRGDAFIVNPDGPDSTLGTHVKMSKSGKLCSQVSIVHAGSTTIHITKNQATLNANSNTTSEMIASGSAVTSPFHANAAGCKDVSNGDYIRLSDGAAPSSSSVNFWELNFQEQDIQVSVSNTLPQFSDTDTYVRASSNGGQSITAAVTNIPFIAVDDSKGLWNGTTFTTPENGIYNFAGQVQFTAANSTIDVIMYINGNYARRVLQQSQTTATMPFSFPAEKLSKGDLVTFRTNATGMTVQTGSDHWLTITKDGKPNVTGVDVTPFVNTPTIDKHSTYMSSASTYVGSANLSGALTYNNYTSVPLISYNSSTGVYTMLKKGTATITAQGTVTNSAPLMLAISVNGTVYSRGMVANGAGVGWGDGATWKGELNAGDFFTPVVTNGSVNGVTVTTVVESNSEQVVAPVESFSSDTATLTWASGSTYTYTTLATAPVGTFITYNYAASSVARSPCTIAPTQSTADMAANGIRVYSRDGGYSVGTTCTSPTVIAIQIGKNFKGLNVDLYKSTSKTMAGSLGYWVNGSSTKGCATKEYTESTGILMIDCGFLESSSVTFHQFYFSDVTNQNNGYVVINASKTPTLSGISYVAPRVAILSDVKTSGTNGGTSVATTWTARTLNTEDDASDFVTMSGNQFTLPSGEYIIEGCSPAHQVGAYKMRIRNVTDSSTAINGVSSFSNAAASYSQVTSCVIGRFTLTASKAFEAQYYAGASNNTYNLGVADSSGESEVYTQLKITKVK